MIQDIALTEADKDWLPEDYWQSIPEYMRSGIQKHFAQRRLAMLAAPSFPLDADMGVTGNAILLLGYIGGAVSRDGVYEIESAYPVTGGQVVRHCASGNHYAIAVRQIDGVE